MTRRLLIDVTGRQLVVGLLLYGLVAGAGGYMLGARAPEGTPETVDNALTAIRSLRARVNAQGDTLQELRTAAAAAAAADVEASAAADSTTEVNEPAIADAEARYQVVSDDIRSRVDSTVAVLVDELEASHDRVVARLRANVEAERRARYTSNVRVTVLEGQVRALERTVATLEETIAEYERLEDARIDQVRSLRAQRAGGYIIAGGAILCAFLCGG